MEGKGRGKREEGRGKREEGRGKREEGRGKREEGRGKTEEGRGERGEGRGEKVKDKDEEGEGGGNVRRANTILYFVLLPLQQRIRRCSHPASMNNQGNGEERQKRGGRVLIYIADVPADVTKSL